MRFLFTSFGLLGVVGASSAGVYFLKNFNKTDEFSVERFKEKYKDSRGSYRREELNKNPDYTFDSGDYAFVDEIFFIDKKRK